ncbi:MAG: SDR family NAD(P)-dependent oxidoreductase, partial [Chloroflexi bacterium]|nr:SDR family NAD(P)-dependent oxidoreductase [Chloroflexota bacterium]
SARRKDKLEEAAKEMRALGGEALVVQADVTNEKQVADLFKQAMAKFGRVDILVNNSGAFDGGPIEDLSLATWQKVVDVNLTGVFLCTREAFKIMKKQKGGRIINIGSISAQMPRMNSAPYTATKHGLVGLTKSSALEGRAHGISVGTLHPGNVMTELRASSADLKDAEPMMEPDDIAVAALAMASLPPYANMLETIVLPVEQQYLGRG